MIFKTPVLNLDDGSESVSVSALGTDLKGVCRPRSMTICLLIPCTDLKGCRCDGKARFSVRRHLLIVFGGLAGLEESTELDGNIEVRAEVFGQTGCCLAEWLLDGVLFVSRNVPALKTHLGHQQRWKSVLDHGVVQMWLFRT